jgi:hypothetical protein
LNSENMEWVAMAASTGTELPRPADWVRFRRNEKTFWPCTKTLRRLRTLVGRDVEPSVDLVSLLHPEPLFHRLVHLGVKEELGGVGHELVERDVVDDLRDVVGDAVPVQVHNVGRLLGALLDEPVRHGGALVVRPEQVPRGLRPVRELCAAVRQIGAAVPGEREVPPVRDLVPVPVEDGSRLGLLRRDPGLALLLGLQLRPELPGLQAADLLDELPFGFRHVVHKPVVDHVVVHAEARDVPLPRLPVTPHERRGPQELTVWVRRKAPLLIRLRECLWHLHVVEPLVLHLLRQVAESLRVLRADGPGELVFLLGGLVVPVHHEALHGGPEGLQDVEPLQGASVERGAVARDPLPPRGVAGYQRLVHLGQGGGLPGHVGGGVREALLADLHLALGRLPEVLDRDEHVVRLSRRHRIPRLAPREKLLDYGFVERNRRVALAHPLQHGAQGVQSLGAGQRRAADGVDEPAEDIVVPGPTALRVGRMEHLAPRAAVRATPLELG